MINKQSKRINLIVFNTETLDNNHLKRLKGGNLTINQLGNDTITWEEEESYNLTNDILAWRK